MRSRANGINWWGKFGSARSCDQPSRKQFLAGAAATALALTALSSNASAQGNGAPAAGATDIAGVVTGTSGPEAGVWVIAETTDLPTRFTKIVVTDDRGRYLIPDLPKANYSVWVRGYGLVDSPRIPAAPGKVLNLTAMEAPNAAAAADYYPPIYWFSLLHVPAKKEFPLGHVQSQQAWLSTLKTGGCNRLPCAWHARYARSAEAQFSDEFADPVDAWTRRIQSGGAQGQMARDIGSLEPARAITLFADWTDRLAKGELPFAKPDRPTGIERNIVVSEWEWGRNTAYLHDEVSTDPRNPRVNADGKDLRLAGGFLRFDSDPRSRSAAPRREVKHPVRDPKTPSTKRNLFAPSVYWGDKPIWDSQTIMHNPMMDEKGHVWFTARIRPAANPAFCKQGSNSPSAKAFPLETSGRQLSMYDPASGKFTLISTCFSTHHLNFAYDKDNTLWLSGGIGGPGVLGWFNRKMYDETGDEAKAQGWTAFVVDTNGNGKRDAYTEPGQPADPKKDTRVLVTTYAVAVSPSDGAVWGTEVAYPGRIVRVAPGPEPAGNRACRSLSGAAARIRTARRRCRFQRRVLGGARERPSRQF